MDEFFAISEEIDASAAASVVISLRSPTLTAEAMATEREKMSVASLRVAQDRMFRLACLPLPPAAPPAAARAPATAT